MSVISSNEKIKGIVRKVHLVLDITNQGTTPLDLNQLFSHDAIILTDTKSNAYSLKKLNYQNSILKVGEKSQREIDIILPKEIELHQLSTPIQQLLLLQK
jgi:hypothetical protein